MSLLDALFLDLHRDPHDVWIACRTDGQAGSGTAADPYNGSTPERFDAVMNAIPAYSRIQLGPGTFLTRGYYDGAPAGYGWQPKPGQSITGSGVAADGGGRLCRAMPAEGGPMTGMCDSAGLTPL